MDTDKYFPDLEDVVVNPPDEETFETFSLTWQAFVNKMVLLKSKEPVVSKNAFKSIAENTALSSTDIWDELCRSGYIDETTRELTDRFRKDGSNLSFEWDGFPKDLIPRVFDVLLEIIILFPHAFF